MDSAVHHSPAPVCLSTCLDSTLSPAIQVQPAVTPLNGPLVLILDNVLTPRECLQLIAFSEASGYERAFLNVGGGRQEYRPDVRNNDRCILDDVETAEILWRRLNEYLPSTFDGRTLVGINERLRFLRYDVGHEFKPHYDGTYDRGNGEYSVLTIQVYLNDVASGGGTGLWLDDSSDEPVLVEPRPGRVLIFAHEPVCHSGEPVLHGRKYAIRSDIMSRPRSHVATM
ncbi:hypothetical protein SPRG_06452 [Saprolegnia parasitica CBS 223.65]|uniref:Prolyl 4-hydroxylase alpha subunit domain-containing protein n=1 Tax=Saprolegnia parasitica (strain CBS 223.65) TaxID=695850 RepID=A0A067CPY9_SAPPC|nr:hypothetical protein SPRG_06452 [Saprolegnia parasitica CBS 223.65]KDO28596.1 hypothetical protein SPRG_06452 [Saprolegnia parasitica CBS 223.65]|eukprot:XP_012200659.1 hypothetical protein SPRG_06452 [Saprolegnia parasitica CBS 223.65]